MTGYAVGVDLGGTNLRVALFRDVPRAPAPIREHREPVGAARDPAAIVARLGAAVESLCADEAPTAPVGVGIAGMLRGERGHVANAPHLRWLDVPFGDLLRERLTDRRVVVANDVNAITWGEFVVGAGRGARDVLGVFVGTGIGSGIVAKGELVEGATGSAAELGHVKVVLGESAAPCNCGLRGCVEAYAGGAYLLERVARAVAEGTVTAAAAHAGGGTIYPQHVDRAAAEGDAYALALWSDIAPLLAAALANAVTTLNPARLILGGGVLGQTPTLRQMTIDAMQSITNPPALEGLAIVEAELGDDAGLVGSALLAVK